MKQRIIATILLLVTVLTTFAGCANYAFAEDKNFGEYVTVYEDALLKALHSIEIEKEDFGPEEDREQIVVDEIYNTLLTALNKDADNKKTDGTIGLRDMVEYYYYCTYEGYNFNYTMTTTSNTLTTSSSTDAEKDLKKAIVEKIVEGYTFDKETAYEITKTLTNQRITTNDTIVVSYTHRVESGDTVTYTDYANKTISAGDVLFDEILKDEGAVLIGSYKPGVGLEIGGEQYKNIVISHIVNKPGTCVTVDQTTEDEQDVTAYDANGVKTTLTIPEGATVTYTVFPVAYVSAPEIDADNIIRYVLGDDITTDSLAVLGSTEYTLEDGTTVKDLVEALAAEYKNDAAHYETLDYVVAAKDALTAERQAAKEQAIKDAVKALAEAKKDGVTATGAILAHYNEGKAEDEQAADINAVFEALYTADGKIKFAKLIEGGILTLYTYKTTAGVSAVTLINAISDEYAADVNTAYESYAKDLDSKKAGNEIDVADKRERYEDAVATAQNDAVNALIENILKCEKEGSSVASVIVSEYEESVYKTTFTSYDLIKNILLTSSSSDSTFSFIEDLSDYVYGTSTLDDEDRETFTSILKELVAEFGKTTSDYENVQAVKDAKKALEEAELATEEFDTVSEYASRLKEYKKDDQTAFNSLVAKYIELHPETVFVVKDPNTNQKLASSYSTTVLQLILDDEDNVDAYRAAIADHVKGNGEAKLGAVNEFNYAVELNAATNVVEEKETAYAEAQEQAHESAVNALIAKLLSGVLTEDHEGEEETHKLSVVLAQRYVENTINSKISTYNSNIQNKLSKAIYEIINDESIVVIDDQSKYYPENLIKEFIKSIEEGYEYTFYTGNSSETAPGTPGAGVSAEDRVLYNQQMAIYNEANAAITSANTGISNAITAYVNALVTIYDMEAIVAARSDEDTDTTYFDENNALAALAKAYYDANTEYNTANAANTAAKKALTTAQNELAQAEKYLETAKGEKIDFSNLFGSISDRAEAIKDAKAKVKAAEKAVEEADAALNGTKKTNGTKQALEAATTKLSEAKDALVEAFVKTGDDTKFVESENTYTTKKNAYTSAAKNYDTDKTDYESKKAIVENAGEEATETQKNNLKTAEDKYIKSTDAYLKAAKEYADAALAYYGNANAVKDLAQPDFDAAAKILDDEKDEDGNVITEGLKTKIANAEKDTAGETLTNLEAYGTLDAYLEYVLGYNYEEVIREEAVEMLNQQIRVYAVANVLNSKIGGYEVAIDEDTTITVEGYKAAIEAREDTFKALLSHSITHDDEDMKPAKLERKLKKSYKELLESTDDVLVTKKVYREYKNDLGRSNYIYAKNQYGDNNLRMYLQFENLLTYLLYTDYQENVYAAHHGEYTVLEVKDADGNYTGKLGYLFITYDFLPEDAE